ncbi:hypothetical protein M885DRAFT_528110 [Pelagophyceae sp. CCMP2097]|nr:hypothetical protein M885DRAFT_528110 [Pelagophyceae sp. CCMP2097]
MVLRLACAALALAAAHGLTSPRLARQAPRMQFEAGVTVSAERVAVVGASGYIGRNVVRECVRRGFATTAVVRSEARLTAETRAPLEGAAVVDAECGDQAAIEGLFKKEKIDVVICCLASRSGTESDSMAVDYQASVNALEAARAAGARHFVLLSALCVRKPTLAFQKAKLKTEAALAAQTDVTYSVVRPTAFFKSLSGQVEILKGGGPFVYFDLGGGRSAKCNPISEADLAAAIVDCVCDPSRNSASGDPIWNLGGPESGISMEAQGELIADALAETSGSERKAPWLLPVPISLFDVIIGGIDAVAKLTGSAKIADAAELGRIGKYYAVEDMLTTNPSEQYGKTKLLEHYKRIAVEGQEYDPYTTMFAPATKNLAK